MINLGGGFPAEYVAPTQSTATYAQEITRFLREDFGEARPHGGRKLHPVSHHGTHQIFIHELVGDQKDDGEEPVQNGGLPFTKVSSCNQMVAPPKTTISSRLTHCMGSTLRVLSQVQLDERRCSLTMATPVAT